MLNLVAYLKMLVYTLCNAAFLHNSGGVVIKITTWGSMRGGCVQIMALGFLMSVKLLFCWQLLQATGYVLKILGCFREGSCGCAVMAHCKYWLEI